MKKKTSVRINSRISADILYEDRDVIALNKPPGVLSVPVPGMKSDNLLEAVQHYLDDVKRKAHTVHRIDRYTSGVVLFAKNRKSRDPLIAQFRNHEPARIYLALVRGVPQKEEDELIHYLKRIKEGFRNVVVSKEDPSGTRARLNYRVIEKYNGASLLEIALDTGLKNQIRVQLSEIGHPTVGDRHYAEGEKDEPLIDRQALHASRLEFVHPATGRVICIEAPIPKDLKRLLVYFKNRTK
ncbi:RluA family pseudouridine synthase [Balneolaceae bacterium ANBcel3]|nr:RluA family pseudouridine synthase [Balneolaceae bacterium ANBcel3]